MSGIKVLVTGACGRMGSEVVRTVIADDHLDLVAAVDPRGGGRDAAEAAGLPACGILVDPDLAAALAGARPDVVIDFTEPSAALQNALTVIAAGARPVIGTTGLSGAGLDQIRQAIQQKGLSGLVAPNFAIGAVLLIKFAAAAARYLPDCEIIELHHDGKKDAPSGTALYTAEKIAEARGKTPEKTIREEIILEGARGALGHGVPIHSVRLQGYVANQEVIFGGPGQTLTLRHDTIDRKCFMPGVVLAARRMMELSGFFYGLESILDI